jgi:hypothetical protein
MECDNELPKFMKMSLDDAYKQMTSIKTQQEFQHFMKSAPSFVFTKTNDFMQAIKADYIVCLVSPDKYYKFEVLCHDPYRSRIIVDSMEFKRITTDKYKQIVMDYFPINVTT